jgi:hypothetical protein
MLSKKITKSICAIAAAVALPAQSFAADIIVWNGDPDGVGFNDPTPAEPIGGNPGTTRGQQALNVFQRAADAWGQRLQSDQTINIIAFFTPLNCGPTSGVLGAAGANWYFRDVPAASGGKGMPAGTWHHAALAEKLTKTDITTAVDPNDFFEIFTFFNSRLGEPGCLTGSGWYFGLDNNQPSNQIDLLAVVLHEFGHGLGFSAGPTNTSVGIRAQGFPSVWESNMFDASTGKTWLDMTDNERAISARNDGNLVWIGLQANNNVPAVLDREIILNATGVDPIVPYPAAFGASVTQAPGQKTSAPLSSPTDLSGTTLGCSPYADPTALAGQFALVDRGACAFVTKALNAQAAGAAGVLIANNAPGSFFGPGGSSSDVTIPVFGVTQADGVALRAALASGPVVATVGASSNVRAGTTADYPRLYAPTVFAGGSSVSHWDVSMSPSVLMEPSITSELTSSVKNPEDLTRGLLRDIGW